MLARNKSRKPSTLNPASPNPSNESKTVYRSEANERTQDASRPPAQPPLRTHVPPQSAAACAAARIISREGNRSILALRAGGDLHGDGAAVVAHAEGGGRDAVEAAGGARHRPGRAGPRARPRPAARARAGGRGRRRGGRGGGGAGGGAARAGG